MYPATLRAASARHPRLSDGRRLTLGSCFDTSLELSQRPEGPPDTIRHATEHAKRKAQQHTHTHGRDSSVSDGGGKAGRHGPGARGEGGRGLGHGLSAQDKSQRRTSVWGTRPGRDRSTLRPPRARSSHTRGGGWAPRSSPLHQSVTNGRAAFLPQGASRTSHHGGCGQRAAFSLAQPASKIHDGASGAHRPPFLLFLSEGWGVGAAGAAGGACCPTSLPSPLDRRWRRHGLRGWRPVLPSLPLLALVGRRIGGGGRGGGCASSAPGPPGRVPVDA